MNHLLFALNHPYKIIVVFRCVDGVLPVCDPDFASGSFRCNAKNVVGVYKRITKKIKYKNRISCVKKSTSKS